MIATTQNKVYDKLQDIEEAFKGYFETSFTTTSPSIEDIECSTRAILQRVTNKIKAQLNQDYTQTKIELVLKKMAPLKSPGHDGLFLSNAGTLWEMKYVRQC